MFVSAFADVSHRSCAAITDIGNSRANGVAERQEYPYWCEAWYVTADFAKRL